MAAASGGKLGIGAYLFRVLLRFFHSLYVPCSPTGEGTFFEPRFLFF